MRKINVCSLGKKGSIVGTLSVLIAAFSATAIAQCGGSFTSMAAAAASIQIQSQVSQTSIQNKSSAVNDDRDNASIVGLWHIGFFVDTPGGPVRIQEAFQIWNAGGTEAHNPNVDPRTGNICFGAWKRVRQTFQLTHRVWNYDAGGNFLGTINLNETIVLGDKGNTHTGSFTLDFFDPSGNFLFEVPGTVVGERISVN